MTDDTKILIQAILKAQFTKGCGDWRVYEQAKGYIDNMGLVPPERDEAITMITDYLGI